MLKHGYFLRGFRTEILYESFTAPKCAAQKGMHSLKLFNRDHIRKEHGGGSSRAILERILNYRDPKYIYI